MPFTIACPHLCWRRRLTHARLQAHNLFDFMAIATIVGIKIKNSTCIMRKHLKFITCFMLCVFFAGIASAASNCADGCLPKKSAQEVVIHSSDCDIDHNDDADYGHINLHFSGHCCNGCNFACSSCAYDCHPRSPAASKMNYPPSKDDFIPSFLAFGIERPPRF